MRNAAAAAAAAAVLALALALTACARAPEPPAPARVEPAQGLEGIETPVAIRGAAFWAGATVGGSCAREPVGHDDRFAAWLGDVELSGVAQLDPETLSATVPATLALGVYDLTVTGPYGTATLPGAFEVVTVLTDSGMPDAGPGADGGDAAMGPDGGAGTACSNGLDDDGDTAIDFPADPGCTSAADDDETNTLPAESCMGDTPDPVPPDGFVSGSTMGMSADADYSGTCGGGGSAGDVVYEIDLPAGAVGLQISTEHPGTNYDTLIYVRDDCDEILSELGCDNDSGTGTVSMLRIEMAFAAGTYFVFIDGNGASGMYEASIDVWLGAGAACDPAMTTGTRCAPELACAPSAPAPFTCQPAGCALATTFTISSPPGTATDSGSTSALPNLHAGTCGMGFDGGTRAPEAVYQLTLGAAVGNVHVDTEGSGYDTLIYVRDGCTGSEVACDDDSGTGLLSALDTGPLPAGAYFIFVDGFALGAGAYVLNVDVM